MATNERECCDRTQQNPSCKPIVLDSREPIGVWMFVTQSEYFSIKHSFCIAANVYRTIN